jgi:hypothetical protein
VAPEAQLEWESRAGRPVAAAAFLAALLPILGGIYGRGDRPELGDAPRAEALIALDRSATDALVGTAIQAVGVLLLIPVFVYLYRAIKKRREEFPRVALILAVAGPLLYALVALLAQVDRIDTAHAFADSLPVSDIEDRAEDALSDSSNGVLIGLGLAAALAMASAFVLHGLWGMRAGLFSRFFGTIGIVLGALYVFGFLGGPQIIQLFWLSALGFLLLGLWPGGRGPAWETGTDEPWPSAMDQREAAARARAEEAERLEPESPQGEAGEPEAETHPRSKKRKRKRRR